MRWTTFATTGCILQDVGMYTSAIYATRWMCIFSGIKLGWVRSRKVPFCSRPVARVDFFFFFGVSLFSAYVSTVSFYGILCLWKDRNFGFSYAVTWITTCQTDQIVYKIRIACAPFPMWSMWRLLARLITGYQVELYCTVITKPARTVTSHLKCSDSGRGGERFAQM